jgi:Lrp/AsnC family transcriptional regulator for asnA, asnC and gidA
VSILKTLQQLDEIKDAIKQRFAISSLKTTIWTDVKEMHGNLALEPLSNTAIEKANTFTKEREISNTQKKNIVVDEIDEKIVEKLSENGRSPFGRIAQELGISAFTAKRRYEKLRNNGMIKVTIQIDPAKIGYQAMVLLFVVVSLQENSFSIIERISRIPDVISIMKTSGDYDLMVYALVRDLNQLLSIQDDIGKIPGINKMDIEISRILNKWPTPRQYMSTF